MAYLLDLSYYAFQFQLTLSLFERIYDFQSQKWTLHSILCDGHALVQECLATADFSILARDFSVRFLYFAFRDAERMIKVMIRVMP